MRVLVTGARGKVGAATTAALLRAGHEVLATDLGTPVHERDLPGEAPYVQADLTDAGAVYALVRDVEAVVHSAAIPDPIHHAPHVVFGNNVLAGFNVVEACVRAGVRRLVNLSSETVPGMIFAERPFLPPYLPLDELTPARPQDPYGFGKHVRSARAAARWSCAGRPAAGRLHDLPDERADRLVVAAADVLDGAALSATTCSTMARSSPSSETCWSPRSSRRWRPGPGRPRSSITPRGPAWRAWSTACRRRPARPARRGARRSAAVGQLEPGGRELAGDVAGEPVGRRPCGVGAGRDRVVVPRQQRRCRPASRPPGGGTPASTSRAGRGRQLGQPARTRRPTRPARRSRRGRGRGSSGSRSPTPCAQRLGDPAALVPVAGLHDGSCRRPRARRPAARLVGDRATERADRVEVLDLAAGAERLAGRRTDTFASQRIEPSSIRASDTPTARTIACSSRR
jgi:hypothetical protein